MQKIRVGKTGGFGKRSTSWTKCLSVPEFSNGARIRNSCRLNEHYFSFFKNIFKDQHSSRMNELLFFQSTTKRANMEVSLQRPISFYFSTFKEHHNFFWKKFPILGREKAWR
ncbi:hypothetical protein XO10_09750 [Marinitoga sp. 1135]|nr:hypothetical protein [Marinitoga sp. 1135]